MTKPKLGLVAVRDRDRRSSINKALRRLGWTVIEHASGFHLIQALSEVILGNALSPIPNLIVVDAISAGCSGVTIAAGFRDLGLAIPIILIAPAEASDVASDAYAHSVILVDPASASIALVAIAKLMPAHHGRVLDAAFTEEPKRHPYNQRATASRIRAIRQPTSDGGDRPVLLAAVLAVAVAVGTFVLAHSQPFC